MSHGTQSEAPDPTNPFAMSSDTPGVRAIHPQAIHALLQSKEVRPEDYELLQQLDESVRMAVCAPEIVDLLPTTVVSNPPECCICGEGGDSYSAMCLPCGHQSFHEKCVRRWLTEYRDACPVCAQPADPTAFADRKSHTGAALPGAISPGEAEDAVAGRAEGSAGAISPRVGEDAVVSRADDSIGPSAASPEDHPAVVSSSQGTATATTDGAGGEFPELAQLQTQCETDAGVQKFTFSAVEDYFRNWHAARFPWPAACARLGFSAGDLENANVNSFDALRRLLGTKRFADLRSSARAMQIQRVRRIGSKKDLIEWIERWYLVNVALTSLPHNVVHAVLTGAKAAEHAAETSANATSGLTEAVAVKAEASAGAVVGRMGFAGSEAKEERAEGECDERAPAKKKDGVISWSHRLLIIIQKATLPMPPRRIHRFSCSAPPNSTSFLPRLLPRYKRRAFSPTALCFACSPTLAAFSCVRLKNTLPGYLAMRPRSRPMCAPVSTFRSWT